MVHGTFGGRLCVVGRGTKRAEDAQGTPTQSHISPSILVYEDKKTGGVQAGVSDIRGALRRAQVDLQHIYIIKMFFIIIYI